MIRCVVVKECPSGGEQVLTAHICEYIGTYIGTYISIYMLGLTRAVCVIALFELGAGACPVLVSVPLFCV